MNDLRDLVNQLERRFGTQPEPKPEPLEAVLKGKAVELWSDLAGERLWLVADEEDAALLGEHRGSIYSAHEARMVCRITNAAVVKQVHGWKRRFDAKVSEVRREGK